MGRGKSWTKSLSRTCWAVVSRDDVQTGTDYYLMMNSRFLLAGLTLRSPCALAEKISGPRHIIDDVYEVSEEKICRIASELRKLAEEYEKEDLEQALVTYVSTNAEQVATNHREELRAVELVQFGPVSWEF